MPIVRFKNKVIYFSHIPKCGGTSIENFLKIITGVNPSFLNRNFYKNSNLRWSISSPQHISGNDLSRLFPITFFDEFFAVTRHPLDRFSSAFHFQKYFAKRIAEEIEINQFVSQLDKYQALFPGKFDNHFLPQINFLYPGATYKVFKLENGLDVVKEYLGYLFDLDVNNISMPHLLKQTNHIILHGEALSDNSKKIIMDIYKVDFEKFNY